MTQSLETTGQLSADDRRRLLAEMLQKKANRAAERPFHSGKSASG